MKRRDWFFALSPVLLVWGIDRFTKIWAMGYTAQGPHWFPWGGFILHYNPGAMLGMFSDLPPILRIVSLATSGAFLIFIYAIFQFFLPEKILRFRIGMSILLGGILGNVTDRILWGSVVDFLVLGQGKWMSPAFNLADSLQWVGYGLMVHTILFQGHLLWPENNARKKLWIDPAYQFKFSVFLASASLWFSLITGVFAFTFIKVMVSDFVLNGTSNGQRYLAPFISIFFLLAATFAISQFLIGRHLSHRSAGPIHAFKRYVRDLRSGNFYELQLRKKDDFKDLEEIAELLLKDYKERADSNKSKKAEAC